MHRMPNRLAPDLSGKRKGDAGSPHLLDTAPLCTHRPLAPGRHTLTVNVSGRPPVSASVEVPQGHLGTVHNWTVRKAKSGLGTETVDAEDARTGILGGHGPNRVALVVGLHVVALIVFLSFKGLRSWRGGNGPGPRVLYHSLETGLMPRNGHLT